MSGGEAVPLRAGSPEAAASLMAVFRRAQFNERAICDALHLSVLDGVDYPVFKTLEDRLAGLGLLSVLARLFVFGDAVDRAEVREHVTEAELQAFTDADLVRPWPTGASPDALFSPVRLVPVHLPTQGGVDLLIAGDRGDHPDGSRFVPFADLVFPGHNPLTRQFLRLLPQPRGAVLDLCSGTGVAALAMAGNATQCTAADIATRSVHFARFNAWLNGCPHVDVVCGDLYEPVAGRRFDCIVAHPPYVPALANKLTYRDGGETGDQIVRGVIAGAGDHLNPGGTFHLLCLGMDTGEGSFEQRVRSWIGPAEREFDVVFALDSTTPPEVIATRLIDRSGGTTADLLKWRELFTHLQVKEFVYGAIVGRRLPRGVSGETFTRRVLLTNDSTAAGFEWLFRWFDWMRRPGGSSRILDARPSMADDLRLEVQHRVERGTFAPVSYFLENGGKPFRARLATEAWVAALLSEMDGRQTIGESFASARARGRVPPDFGERQLEQLMCQLVERGCLTLDA
jgi:SAM-dependent methyltransferase